MTTATQQVSFIQSSLPPLRTGSYRLVATQTVPGQTPGRFSAAATFVVSGERFSIQPTEIDSVFPPPLATGPFDGVLPHVVLDRCTLPWERTIDVVDQGLTHPTAPWLAVLVLDDGSAPPLQSVTVQDLLPLGTPITVTGAPSITGTGTLAATTVSYGAAVCGTLEYGETPDDPCQVIDLPIDVFGQIVPAAADLPYLAHVREVDTSDGADADSTAERHAVVIANRIPAAGVSRGYLVSLEGMGGLLPDVNGGPIVFEAGVTAVRLVVHHTWAFTTNDRDDTLELLLTGLNANAGSTSLALPITGTAPTSAGIAQATGNLAAGTMTADDATALMQNALLMGYVPLDHHVRHGGQTVSFYRGPLVPLAVPAAGTAHYPGPDAANAYDPQTGLFDVSYGAAWQLGQLLALQNAGMANLLYQWKHQIQQVQALTLEESRLQGGGDLFPSLLTARAAALAVEPPPLPTEVATWFGQLASLAGVPFNYVVADERMLPAESLRFCYLDDNWLDALIDGAFSVGRAAVGPDSLETAETPAIRRVAREQCGLGAANRLAAVAGSDPATPVTGFLLRSAAVTGWPNLRIVGFSDEAATVQLPVLRIAQLSDDTVLCLFRGEVAVVFLREPPEQLHHGVDVTDGDQLSDRVCSTTLRSVSGGPAPTVAGAQYDPPGGTQEIALRGDYRTLAVSAAAGDVSRQLQGAFQQSFAGGSFTSAEFALELTRGVLEVEFRR